MTDGKTDSGATAQGERFTLSRWSRLKRGGAAPAVTAGDSVGAAVALPAATPAPAISAAPLATGATITANAEELQLPPLSSISLSEDFTPFMQAKVPAALRQQALKALFREPHFNAMDGLDTYIDDYTRFEPIAPEVLEKLSAWQTIKNPPQVVVADGGYAVDVASDEGQAILATRAARESVVESPSDEAATPVAALPDAPSAPPLAPHARHGTRVGDFSAASVTASAAASGEPAPDPQNEVPAVARVAAPATDNPAAP